MKKKLFLLHFVYLSVFSAEEPNISSIFDVNSSLREVEVNAENNPFMTVYKQESNFLELTMWGFVDKYTGNFRREIDKGEGEKLQVYELEALVKKVSKELQQSEFVCPLCKSISKETFCCFITRERTLTKGRRFYFDSSGLEEEENPHIDMRCLGNSCSNATGFYSLPLEEARERRLKKVIPSSNPSKTQKIQVQGLKESVQSAGSQSNDLITQFLDREKQ